MGRGPCVCVCVVNTETAIENERLGQRDADTDRKQDGRHDQGQTFCLLPFSIWMIPLPRHNPSEICLFRRSLWNFTVKQPVSIPASQSGRRLIFSRASALIRHSIKPTAGLPQLDLCLTTLIIQLVYFQYPPPPRPSLSSIYTPLGSRLSMGLLGAVVILSLWMLIQLTGQLR